MKAPLRIHTRTPDLELQSIENAMVPQRRVQRFKRPVCTRGALYSQLSPLLSDRHRQLRPAGGYCLSQWRTVRVGCSSPAATT